jgi:hypothetical protein
MGAVLEIDRADGRVAVTSANIAELVGEVRRLRGILDEIDRTVRIPTPKGTGAYTHFMRDFDKIRKLCAGNTNP